MRLKLSSFRLIVCALALALTGAAGSRLTVDVWPRIGVSPQDVRVTLHHEPAASDRVLEVVADGPMLHRSVFQLDGAEGNPPQRTYWLRELPIGEYDVTARLYDSARVVATASTIILVN
jgi:hypothetical protein